MRAHTHTHTKAISNGWVSNVALAFQWICTSFFLVLENSERDASPLRGGGNTLRYTTCPTRWKLLHPSFHRERDFSSLDNRPCVCVCVWCGVRVWGVRVCVCFHMHRRLRFPCLPETMSIHQTNQLFVRYQKCIGSR